MYTAIGPGLTIATQAKNVLELLPQFHENVSTALGGDAKHNTLLEIIREKQRTKCLCTIAG